MRSPPPRCSSPGPLMLRLPSSGWRTVLPLFLSLLFLTPQFVSEVDTSHLGVGAILSQRLVKETTSLCFPVQEAFSFRSKLYDVGARELLAIKVALEEWRHLLEGTEQPFLLWIDHPVSPDKVFGISQIWNLEFEILEYLLKNLEYLKSAKRLNPREARWALFFSRFNFSLSYCPGSKNLKPDSLSRLFCPDSNPESNSPILPSSCFLGRRQRPY